MHFALTKSLGGMHAMAITAAALLDGAGSTTWALTADAHGRLMAHNLSKHLSVAASAFSSFARGLTGGGGAAGPSHLIPLQQAAAGGASFDPGAVCALLPLHSGVGGAGGGLASAGQQQFAPDAATALFVPEAGHFLLVVCTRAVLVCLLTLEGRLQVLHVFLPPPRLPADCSPHAAWRLSSPLPGGRRGSASGAAAASPLAGAGGSVTVQLAVAWQWSLSVYRAVLLQRRPPAAPPTSAPGAPPQRLPPPALLRSWTVPGGAGGAGGAPASPAGSAEAGVCCCHFLDSGPLVVVSSQGETSTAVHVYRRDALTTAGMACAAGSTGGSGGGAVSEEGAVESMLLRDWVVAGQAVAFAGTGSAAFHQSAAGFGDQLLLLNSQGVRVVQLLSWQQRLSALVSHQQLPAALLAAVRVYQAATGAAAAAGDRQLAVPEAAWPADGQAAPAPEVQRQLLTILCALVDQELAQQQAQQQQQQQQAQQEGGTEQASSADAGAAGGSVAGDGTAAGGGAAVERLADTAVGCCLLVRRPDALWEHLWPRFQRWPPAAAAFLQHLLPAILSDRLPSVAPEVMQALVEHCVAEGRPEAVERCVLKMDLLSLDLNQLIPLCIRHRLFSALLHIFASALQDHSTPAALLLVAAAAAGEAEAEAATAAAAAELAAAAAGGAWAAAQGSTAAAALQARESLRLAYKLLLFLRCCLLGLGYPPGAGGVPPEQQQRGKAQALVFLLFSTGLSGARPPPAA
ncbi:vacuolar sorting-associated 8-like protein isoform X1 [Micractinium conductrix]|uniref:Vacuolar sorting-associated 8-like protein isoform X1 n=1 Tax=Micractinium conductrix TaxID=554055 RepID=A0A2P6UZF3_9CHLO|nr:vacuolar sorting-associated 8-like protein isoform X1 [Micractinium conductrix]|eukprot:PSC67213.1 vacuolar sorting-associated 8-like protein isoform X1 [Micractinium conductrix]